MRRFISFNLDTELNVQTGIGKTYFPVRGWKLSDDEMKNQTNEVINQRGFYLDPKNNHFIFHYPQEFVAPTNNQADKYVIFQYCRATVDGHFHSELEVHASFIPRDQYCNYLVYYCNLQVPDDNRKYRVNENRKQGFEVWFIDGTQKDPDHQKAIIPDSFVLFLKLIY